jgi:hypothetical protein
VTSFLLPCSPFLFPSCSVFHFLPEQKGRAVGTRRRDCKQSKSLRIAGPRPRHRRFALPANRHGRENTSASACVLPTPNGGPGIAGRRKWPNTPPWGGCHVRTHELQRPSRSQLRLHGMAEAVLRLRVLRQCQCLPWGSFAWNYQVFRGCSGVHQSPSKQPLPGVVSPSTPPPPFHPSLVI